MTTTTPITADPQPRPPHVDELAVMTVDALGALCRPSSGIASRSPSWPGPTGSPGAARASAPSTARPATASTG